MNKESGDFAPMESEPVSPEKIQHIQKKIERVIAEWNMLPEGCGVVVGLSGGADSMALAHFLFQYGKARHIPLTAAHINHGIRGAEADRDEQFVSDWCKKNQIPCKVLHADVPKLARERGMGLEECGRAVRYEFFRSICGKNDRIATAHTLSDQAETVLMNLAKGAGTHGLRGIPPVRGQIVRPLLAVTRAEVEAYCAYYQLSYVTDSTNDSEEYARNKIRHSVIPALKEINPSFESAVAGMTRHLSQDDFYLSELARESLSKAQYHGGYRVSLLRRLPQPVLARAVMQAISAVSSARQSSGNIEAVMEILRSGFGSVTAAGGIQCTIQGNTLFIAPQSAAGKMPEHWCVPFCAERTVLPDGRVLSVVPISRKEYENRLKFNNLLFNNAINYDTIFKITSVRNRSNGDVFRPAGRGVTKTLKKLFNEARLEPMLRSNAVILESGGTIAWLEGFGAGEGFCITDKTQNIAEIIIV
ncbi:MAG: tRNA lysidine(34) synthetase TilS [Ruminococcaceae bacterium]|nr:tRNA lysidine(34) synthetase TilS [Oscillospiraceae bacterium]HHV33026.1 tRNA lysidine(34) synthetase TilS [Clostridiales bacterium]